MLTRVFCASTFGVDANIIFVETNIAFGMPKFFLVGLPDRSINESHSRVEAALKNSGYQYPYGRITVSLGPADLPKEGSAFDLPIAIGMLSASRQLVSDELENSLMLGELALDGSIRSVRGVLPITLAARDRGFTRIILPFENAREAGVIDGIQILAVKNLQEAIGVLNGQVKIEPVKTDIKKVFEQYQGDHMIDFSDVKGHENVKRALEVAAAGGHNVIMVGPPGSGKTMMARRIPTILPPLTLDEALETTKIHSVSGLLNGKDSLVSVRPFRSPHHTISDVALVGGGTIPMPGEMSLAHHGVLFLDELPEFKRSALEVMRQPLEDGFVSISRARMSVRYPSSIMLVASMNPSPGGEWPDHADHLASSQPAMKRYLAKISGPMLDRIDLHIEVTRLSYDELTSKSSSENSTTIRERVVRAREMQSRRFMGMKGIHCNAHMPSRLTRKICTIDAPGSALLQKAITMLGLSARAYDRILKVARTIADLELSETIKPHHLAESIQYRNLDREGWLG